MNDTIEDRVRRIINDIVDGGDYSLMPELLAEDFVEHSPMGDLPGPAGFQGFIEQFRAALPGFRHEVSDVRELADGFVVFLVHFSGTFTGSFMGTDGDGRTVSLAVANAARFVDGKLAEHWGMGPDTSSDLLSQMGVEMVAA